MNDTNPVPDIWAIVELMGHNRMAGRISEQVLGGNFIRIDVPETSTQAPYCRLVNPTSVYAINPVTEEVARHMAERLLTKPLEAWDIREMEKKTMTLAAGRKALANLDGDDDVDLRDDNDDDSDF